MKNFLIGGLLVYGILITYLFLDSVGIAQRLYKIAKDKV